MPAASKALREARKKLATAEAQRDHWRGKTHEIRAEYDVLKTNKLRRTPRRETKGEGGIYDMLKRLLGANIGRDLERNCATPKGIIHQFRENVVGSLGKLQLNIKGGEDGAAFFNEVWSKDCDYREDVHWSTMNKNVVASILREGDMLGVVDDGITEEDSGKLLTWESDQVIPVTEGVFKALGFKDGKQENGLVRAKWGKITHYLATGKRGVTVIDKKEDVTPFPRGVARLPVNPWRLNQGRGVPTMVSAAASFLDIYEMLARELQTAKRAAADYARIYREDAVDDWETPGSHPEYLPENDGKTATEVAAEGANSATHPEARNYESLEAFTGGHVDYGDPKDKVDWADSNRPTAHMPEFIEAVHCHAGAAFGLARAYTLLKADTSYTAFRGDMIMTWQGAFYPMQKWLERSWADWVAVRVLGWAQHKKIIGTLPDGWERKISWAWPTMPQVDPLKEQTALQKALKNGATDYAAILGPDWRNKLEALAEQIDAIRELQLPLSILEMASGGRAGNPGGNQNAASESKSARGQDAHAIDAV
jgi:capsid protein